MCIRDSPRSLPQTVRLGPRRRDRDGASGGPLPVTGLSSGRALLLAQRDLDLQAVARSFAECFDGDRSLVLTVDGTGKELEVAAAHPQGGAAERALRILSLI